MPRYKTNIERILSEDEYTQMYQRSKDDNERRLMLCLWLSGARPAELLMVKGSDCAYDKPEDVKEKKNLRIRVPTEKLHDDGQFQIRERVLEWPRNSKWVELLIPLLPAEPHLFLLWPEESTRPSIATLEKRSQRIINRLSQEVVGTPLSPYHFRHGLLTNMGEAKNENGEYQFNIFDLKAWKGAKTTKSVEGYVHSRAPLLNMGAINRNRSQQ